MPQNIDPLSIAAAAMSGDVARLSSISNNMVNATTPGYRREIAFARLMTGGPESAGSALRSYVDQRAGAMKQTGQAEDMAIDGEGFFELATPAGLVYTRRGDFRVNEQGQLSDANGNLLQGLGGAIQLQSGAPMEMDRDGVIKQSGSRVGQVKVVQFAAPNQLVRLPGGMFAANEGAQISAAGTYRVRQGYLEASNVDTTAEMVKLMETMRHFEATQKLVQSMDDMTDKALRKLGEF